MTKRYGADVLRLYVASMDYANDISVSERGIKEMSDAYRKIRNTFRYLLGNLEDYREFSSADFDPAALHEIDLWALGRLNKLIRDVRSAYEQFEFYRVYQRIYQFCSVDLSSVYLDILKDRLYAEAADGPARRSAQFVLARLPNVLTRLLAPIIPHTAEESWDYAPAVPEKLASVHLAEFPEADPQWDDAGRETRWNELLALREQILLALESLRKNKQIGSAQEASVQVVTSNADRFQPDRELLATLCIVSEVEIISDPAATADSIRASRSAHAKCERCWNYRPTVGQDPAHPTLCDRCVRVLGSIADGS
jgi:isoleucyl-tRNA synthetase